MFYYEFVITSRKYNPYSTYPEHTGSRGLRTGIGNKCVRESHQLKLPIKRRRRLLRAKVQARRQSIPTGYLLLTTAPQDFVIAGATGIQISIAMTDAQLGMIPAAGI
jgi:hypothetical protein